MVQFNNVALRKAKIVYNFGLSECNRVNTSVYGGVSVQNLSDSTKIACSFGFELQYFFS